MGKIYYHYLQVPAASYHQYFLACFSLTAPTEEWLLTIKILIFHLLKNIYSFVVIRISTTDQNMYLSCQVGIKLK